MNLSHEGMRCTTPTLCFLQMMFGQDVSVAAQDPSYPVYVDSSVIMGMTGGYNSSTKAFDGLEYMPCRPENSFFPDLSKVMNRTLYYKSG